MPPRRSARSSNASAVAMTPIKRIADSPEGTSTPSGPNTTRSSTRGLDSPLTPATSISDDEVQDKKPHRSRASTSIVKKESQASSSGGFDTEEEPKFHIALPPPPPTRKLSNGSRSALTPPSLGKRKRQAVNSSSDVAPPSDQDDEISFIGANTTTSSSRRNAPRKSYKEESETEDDEPILTSIKSKGKQRQKDEDQEALVKKSFAIADEIRNYAFDSDEDPIAGLDDEDEDEDDKPLRRTSNQGKAKAKGRASKFKAEKDEGDDDKESIDHVDDWQPSGDEYEDDSDYVPASKRRARNQAYASDDDTGDDSELSDIEDPESAVKDEAGSTEPDPAEGGSSSSTGRGRYAEELQYETAKQRKARLKSERFAARRKKKPVLSHYQKTVQAIESHHAELRGVWENLAKQPTFQKKHKAEQPEGLTISLLPFQLEGLNWLKQQEHGEWKGGILADEMGMGKTIQMISLFLSDRKKPTLVIAPTVAIMQWRNEIAKYTSDFKVLVWHGASREADVSKLKKFDVVLTSYAVLESSYRKQEVGFRRKGDLLKEKSAVHSIAWHRIVLDEAHNIKERATNTAKGAFALNGTYRWCLSGTPLQNRVGELYSMIRFLGGDPYAYYYCKRCPCKSLHWQFSDRRSCDKCGHTPMHHVCLWNVAILRPIQREGTSVGDGAESFGRLRTLLEKIMLRRTKLERADDMGLPPRTLVVRKDYFNEEEEDLYDSLYRDGARKFSTYIDAGTILNNYSNIFTLLTRMRQLACHPDLVLRSKTGLQQKLIGDEADQSIHLCRICAEEATDPVRSNCRHVFCRECIRQYLDAAQELKAPDCPYCHAQIAIDLEQEALEEVQINEIRQGILGKINLEKWRSSTKIEALVEELNNVRREDSTIKSIVFSQFVNFLDLITFRLQRAGFKVCRLEGNMTPEARDRTIRYFMETPDVTVFLVSLKAGGVALNLTEASRVYLMDPWWNGAVSAQAMDRIHRLGQRRPIVIKQMIIQDSIEARMLELQEKKQNMVNATLANDDSAVSRLSVADLRFLFSLQ